MTQSKVFLRLEKKMIKHTHSTELIYLHFLTFSIIFRNQIVAMIH